MNPTENYRRTAAITCERLRAYINFPTPLLVGGTSGILGQYQFTAPLVSFGTNPDSVSDPRIGFDIRLLGEPGGLLRLGTGAQLIFPNGNRSDYVTDDKTAIYSGFLSIELRDKDGQTLWSYLATPPEASEDVSKDLSTLIVKKLVEALKQEAPSRTAPLPQATTLLKGAGATFPFPVYAKWDTNYRRENPSVQITYESIGSEAGVCKLLAKQRRFRRLGD